MIDWASLLQGAGTVAFIGLIGVLVRGFFTERGTVMTGILDEVKSLRADALEDGKKFDLMNDRLQTAQTALLECMTGKAEIGRELKNREIRIAELEAQVRKHADGKAST